MTLRNILIGVSVFTLMSCIWMIGLTIWASRKRRRAQMLEHRLGLAAESHGNSKTLRLWHDGKEAVTDVAGEEKVDMITRFASMCRDAGWESPVETVLLGVAGAMCVAFVLTLMLASSVIAAMASAMAAYLVFRIYLGHCINKRRSLVENQLIDALELAARSLRMGHPLISAFQLISEEIEAPVGPLFGDIVQQQELGASLDEAIRKTARANNSDDLKLFATAVVIQLRSGGNLADMMERVSSVMRDRMRLARRARVLMAQAQLSKWIMLALPVVMFVLLSLLRPDYMRPLYTDDVGKIILGASILGIALGAFIMNRLSTIRY